MHAYVQEHSHSMHNIFFYFFFKECHLKGVKNPVLIVNYVEVSQTYHQLKPDGSAGDATNTSSSMLYLVTQLHLLTAKSVVFHPHAFKDITEVSGQNPPPGIPVPLCGPVPLHGYSANFSQRCICPSLGTPSTYFLIWV